jgi:hypothetical protein
MYYYQEMFIFQSNSQNTLKMHVLTINGLPFALKVVENLVIFSTTEFCEIYWTDVAWAIWQFFLVLSVTNSIYPHGLRADGWYVEGCVCILWYHSVQ